MNTLGENQLPIPPERSGSCANVCLIVDEMVYVANVGDSRCIMSIDCGT